MPEEFRHSDCLHSLEELRLESIPNGSAAFKKVSFLDWIQILIFVGLIDVCTFRASQKSTWMTLNCLTHMVFPEMAVFKDGQ